MTDEGKDAGSRAGEPSAVIDGGSPVRRTAPPPATEAPSRGVRGRDGLSEHTRNRLAVQLRAMYDTVAQQPVPDRFATLIAQLDDAERGKA